ncbi:hybrid sensor histidine kinase/response regulator [Roseibium sp.]|uniref:hybrid sensor histidine kinase/response regulator n=1 Tax=Roseibium sp. TaxID=1936156 RepID=UPI003A982872
MTDDPTSAQKLALLAHDLRTPLSAMKLTAELIGTEALTDKQSERLDLLIRSIDALSDLAGDLIRSGDQGARERSLCEIVSETVALYRVAADAKGLEISFEADSIDLELPAGKAGAMRRIVTTLLDNAVKYTDSGSVTVTLAKGATAGGDGVLLSVEDTGPGIDPMERGRLFMPYVRGAAGKDRAPGSGLGLWGAKQLVTELGGRLTLTSDAPQGSRFEIELPFSLRGDPGLGEDGRDGPTIDVPEAHVLIVDDNLTNRRLLAALLESFAISCTQAASGSDALDRLQGECFDAVLLDLHMPEMDGLETARRIGQMPEGDSIPLIAVTAALESVGDERLREAGFSQVLAKPLAPAELFEAMEPAREKHRKRMP